MRNVDRPSSSHFNYGRKAVKQLGFDAEYRILRQIGQKRERWAFLKHVVRIQCYWRGVLARRAVSVLLKDRFYAICIIKMKAGRKFREMVARRRQIKLEHKSASLIQRYLKGFPVWK